ncbi:efflux RND transporter permease subunit [Litoreibacter arenae]|uniref:RND multidrug efflux transporter/Acriflavin resistance protein n=1 Tax=Litoreibacter arenae DSM 19593 TaxID=1123360 RepID=S9RMA9_9RHOB|nr:efflux RND transporter permease subunit [Litoreibacter arenae]EPX79245.1 RND multidrug efflux transporter/Acriflavin resistance protein [Litoreibacter arenae DSM 19593]
MTGIVDWAGQRARMIIAFIVMSVVIGAFAYTGLPKEGEPDIEIPALFVSVPFPGISAEDSEKLLVKVMEAKLQDLDGLKTLSGTAAENYAGVAMEFEFGWDKTKILADVRDKMGQAQAEFPEGAEQYNLIEINFSEFPIIIISLSGDLPERTLLRVAKNLQDTIEAMPPILEAGLAGHRDEMLEVIIDPLALEAYNVSAGELINVVTNNNLLIAAGEVETDQGAFSVKIPASFDEPLDVFELPIKVNGDRVVTLGELADIRLTFEDRTGTARFNGNETVALQVVKRKGYNIIDTAQLVRDTVAETQAKWPQELQEAIRVDVTLDQSKTVGNMVQQLEGSVLTAIALVMIVVLASLGTRSALLVGFAIPTSFLLCFILLGIMGISISNIVMFGLILAVGMLVDGAIVVVEYADKRINEGAGPMEAYTDAAKRMFWPIVSSTATTLCAFLPMLFWPGVPGEFMGMLPVTLIFVLMASLIVALIYLPVMGGVSGRISRMINRASTFLRGFHIAIRLVLVAVAIVGLFTAAMQILNPGYLLPVARGQGGLGVMVFGGVFFALMAMFASATMGAVSRPRRLKRINAGYRRTPFGHFTRFIAGNPVMPLVAIGAVGAFVVMTFITFSANNNGVEFFVESETEQAIVYVRARGNLSLQEKDELVRQVETQIASVDGIESIFAFAGEGGLNTNTGGATGPLDTIGQIQIELAEWGQRRDDVEILDEMQAKMDAIPGIYTEILSQDRGPAGGKPVNLRLKGDNWDDLKEATRIARAKFEQTEGLITIEDTLPLPGIDWQIDVDVEAAGRFKADVATVGAMVQLVTRGLLLDTMRVDSSDEEIEIRVRLPEESRVLSTLDNLKVRTPDGLIPLSNFITRKPVAKLGQIDRVDQKRYFDVKADVAPDLKNEDGTIINPNERIAYLTNWLETDTPLPDSVTFEWAGDTEEEAESQAFLSSAFLAALGLMFVILLAQFNSFYNSVLVLLAVVLSTTGVLIGMLVMDQAFSIIMTGTGVVALAGIVVNNNIVLIDTYQEYSRYMPRLEAITRTAEARIRPVLLTTITTMAGLAPMMFGLSLDFFGGGYSINSPTSLWWKQLATAVVFGLGVATVLTLVLTPAMLALRVWISLGAYASLQQLRALGGRGSQTARDLALSKSARKVRDPLILWSDPADLAEPTPADVLSNAQKTVETAKAKLASAAQKLEALAPKTDEEDDKDAPKPNRLSAAE